MAQKQLAILQNSDTRETYYTRRNKKGDKADQKLELKKYSKKLKKHVVFKEIKGHPKKKKAMKTKKKKEQAKVKPLDTTRDDSMESKAPTTEKKVKKTDKK